MVSEKRLKPLGVPGVVLKPGHPINRGENGIPFFISPIRFLIYKYILKSHKKTEFLNVCTFGIEIMEFKY